MESETVKELSHKPTNGFDKRREDINLEGAPPKELTYAELIKQVGEQKSSYDALKKRKTVAIEAQWDKAEKGDNQSFNSLLDRVEGKPNQNVGLTGSDGGPVKIEVEVKMV